MRLFQVASVLAAFSSFTQAWPAGGDGLSGPLDVILRRQATTNNNNGDNNANGGGTTNNNNNNNNNANGGGTNNNNNNAAAASSITTAATLRPTTTATKKHSISVDPRSPAGGISMVTPNAAAGPVYYKIGDWVTLGWNYTSVIVSPTAINAVVSCSAASKTFTVINNQTIGPTGKVFWDSSQVEAQLLTNEYTLIVWDAAQPITATPQAGVLAPNAQFTFGMYEPQPYQNWSSYQNSCPTCNAAGHLEQMTLRFLMGMAGVTVLSFTWFVTSFAAI